MGTLACFNSSWDAVVDDAMGGKSATPSAPGAERITVTAVTGVLGTC